MDLDADSRRVPSLVALCQRAAVAHVDAIDSFGDDLTYELVKPILETCTIDQLQRLETASPHLYDATGEIWRKLCFRRFSLFAGERYSIDDQPQEPDSWRARYFRLEVVEAERMEDAASKLRSKRVEGDERKKEKAVKYTDRLPPPKRAKTGSSWSFQPAKTLFQKARVDANKRQMALTTRILPPAPSSRNYRVLPPNPRTTLPSPSPTRSSASNTSSNLNRVTVNTVIHRRSTAAPSTSGSSTAVSSKHIDASSHNRRSPIMSMSRVPATSAQAQSPPAPPTPPLPAIPSSTQSESSPAKPAVKSPATRRDKGPMSLFLPKRPPKAPVVQRPA